MTATTNPPRENLVRALGEAPELVRDNPNGMPTLRGHFAVWDTWTEIRSVFEGNFMEKFSATSMTKTLVEGRDRMRVLFQHGKDPQIGDKPLGPISRLEPDDTGSYYEVPLLDTSYNRDLIPGLDAGLYGASFRFQVISEDFNKKPARSDHNPAGIPERTVTEAKVMEFGPVTFPAYAQATAGLRSLTDEFLFGKYVGDPERLAELIEEERRLKSRPRVTVTYGDKIADTVEERVEPDPSEETTPPPAAVEPEPSAATTRQEPGTPLPPRFNTREEWLQWISKT
jgi:HK97 family phage prohead protease